MKRNILRHTPGDVRHPDSRARHGRTATLHRMPVIRFCRITALALVFLAAGACKNPIMERVVAPLYDDEKKGGGSAPSSANAITAFVLGVSGEAVHINPAARMVDITVPRDTPSGTFSPVVIDVSPGAVVSSAPPGGLLAFGGPAWHYTWPYTVTAASGAAAAWTLRVRLEPLAPGDAAAWLASAPQAGTPADPVPLPLSTALDSAQWAALLSAISGAGKNVALDLTDCAGGTHSTGGGLYTDGTFDPGTTDTGEQFITTLALPDGATRVKEDTTYDGSSPTFRFFDALESVGGANVETIGDGAFYGCPSLTSVSFPAAETVGGYAFRGCTSLETVILPAAETIGHQTFYNCTSLTSVTLPAAETIGDYAFYGCTSLETVILPAAETVDGFAFEGCYSLETVTLPVVKTLGDYAFHNCTSLETVTLPAVKTLGDYAFAGCTSLETVTLPAAETVSAYAFEGCTSLTSVSFPAVKTLGVYAFEGCTSLTSVTLPASLTTIGGNPFVSCTNLTGLQVASANPSYKSQNGMLLNKAGSTLIAWPTAAGTVSLSPAITDVGYAAFSGCAALISVTLPAAETIGAYAFWDCASLASVTLPAAETIGTAAFWDCTSLTAVNFPAAETIGNNAFRGCTSLASVTLPAAETIGQYAFRNTGNTPLLVTLGAAAPTLGTQMFDLVITAKTVNIKVPLGAIAAGYGMVPTTSAQEVWGNGFRGGGWNGTAMLDGFWVKSYISLTIEELP